LLLEQQQICGPWNNADTHDRGNEKESLLPSFQGGILNLWICPLFQVGSASDLCRSLVRQEIQTRLAQQMEQELLVEEEEKDTNQTKRNQNDPTAPARNGGFNNNNNNKRKSKQRNKNRGRRAIMAGKKKQQYSPQSTPQRPSLCEWAEETAIDFEKERETTTTTDGRESSSSSSDDEATLLTRPYKQDLDFPEINATISKRTRNRNIVLVLGLLDDVLSTAFETVGLSGGDWDDDDTNNDEQEWGNAKSMAKPTKTATAARSTTVRTGE
jgi:hypothetical protein